MKICWQCYLITVTVMLIRVKKKKICWQCYLIIKAAMLIRDKTR